MVDGDVLPLEVRALVDRLRTRPWDDPGGLVNMREAADALLVAYVEVERLTAQADRHRVLIASLLARADTAEAEVVRLSLMVPGEWAKTYERLTQENRSLRALERDAYHERDRLRDGIVWAMDAKTWETMYARLESLNG